MKTTENTQAGQINLTPLIIIISALFFLMSRLAWSSAPFFLDVRSSVDLVFDDAYYYLTIAYNIVNLGASTFDGITETNGYQPLWAWLLTAFEWMFRFDKLDLFRFLLILNCLLLLLPLFALLATRKNDFRLAWIAGLTASAGFYPYVWLLGLETVLFAPLLTLAVLWINQRGVLASRTRVSWLFCLVILVRLDAVSLLLSYCLLLFILMKKHFPVKNALKECVLFLMPSVFTLGLYFVLNTLMFDIPVPISGKAKMLGAPAFSNWGIAVYYLEHLNPVILAGLVLLLLEAVWGRFKEGAFLYGGIGVLAFATLIQYIYYSMFSGWIPWPWYFYSMAMIQIFMVARSCSILFSLDKAALKWFQAPGKYAFLAMLLFLLTAPHYVMSGVLAHYANVFVTSANTYNKRNWDTLNSLFNTDKQLVLAMGDRAGGLGYWAPPNIKVFQLEGLVANTDYLTAREHDYAMVWLNEKIKPDYLVVDRESVPSIGSAGNRTFIIIEPVQGRVVFDHVLTYCFPEQAVVDRHVRYEENPYYLEPNVQRYVFDMKQAVACEGELSNEVNRLLLSEKSPRSVALGSEYKASRLNSYLETLDRQRALRLRGSGGLTL